ncbi:MAG: phage tail protein [Gallionella sp.]|nr:phage tail protein [Gallionella sp.]
MNDSASYPLPAFYFKVVFASSQGNSDTSFQEVSGISSEMETEPIVEGGNQYTRQLPKALKHSNLVLKRGIADMSSPLVVWCRTVLETNFMEPIVPTLVSVHLLNEEGVPLRGWEFADAYPVKWNVEAFNSTKNEVAIETIELSYMSSSRTL